MKPNTPQDETDKLLQEMRISKAVGIPLSYEFIQIRLTEIKSMYVPEECDCKTASLGYATTEPDDVPD